MPNKNLLSKNEIDYSGSRMTDYKWIDTYGIDTVMKNIEAIYPFLYKKPQGWIFDVTTIKNETDRDYQIKILELFISEGNDNFQFNETYTKFKKVSQYATKDLLAAKRNEVADRKRQEEDNAGADAAPRTE